MVETLSIQHKRAYQVSSQWNTAVDEAASGNEQRRNLWTNSRKKWVLEFSKNSINEMMSFFDTRKGRFEAFYWTWQATHPTTGENLGGDGQQYLVRFDDDNLDFKHIREGYSTFTVTLVEVFNA